MAAKTLDILKRLVTERDLVTNDEFDESIEIHKKLVAEKGEQAPGLGTILVKKGYITPGQLERVNTQVKEASQQQIPGYQILAKLGSGAMATVFKARQLSLDREVAIKILPKSASAQEDFIKRFYAEGRAAAKLNHPNIVGALDVGQSGDYHYFVMEFVEGTNVHDELEESYRIAEDEAISIMLQVARGLEHAHQLGLIHRDVKPENIMLTDEGTAKLADMGLARPTTDYQPHEDEKGKAVGSPYYMAPEQILDSPDLDCRADMYAFGATFYHMVVGEVPFEAPNPNGVMKKHIKEALRPPDTVNRHVSRGVSLVIQVCMAKDPDQRYMSTADLVQDLEALDIGEMPLQAQLRMDPQSLADQDDRENADLGISALTKSNGTTITTPVDPEDFADLDEDSIYTQPMFWFAVLGWVVGLVFGLLWLMAMIG